METETTTETPVPPVEGGKEQFVIDSREKAEWALRRIAAKEAEIALVENQARELLRSLNTELESFQGRFRGQLESWARGALAETGGKNRTVKTLCGSLSFHTVPPRLVVASEADALQTARLVCPDAIVEVPASEKLDRKVLGEYAKKQLAEAGEIIPGYQFVEATESFSIKFAGGKGEAAGEGEGDA